MTRPVRRAGARRALPRVRHDLQRHAGAAGRRGHVCSTRGPRSRRRDRRLQQQQYVQSRAHLRRPRADVSTSPTPDCLRLGDRDPAPACRRAVDRVRLPSRSRPRLAPRRPRQHRVDCRRLNPQQHRRPGHRAARGAGGRPTVNIDDQPGVSLGVTPIRISLSSGRRCHFVLDAPRRGPGGRSWPPSGCGRRPERGQRRRPDPASNSTAPSHFHDVPASLGPPHGRARWPAATWIAPTRRYGPWEWEWWKDAEIQKALGLTEAKAQRSIRIYDERVKRVQPIVEKFQAELKELEKMVSERQVSVEVFALQVTSVEALRSELSKSRTIMNYRISRELTPEQNTKLSGDPRQAVRRARRARRRSAEIGKIGKERSRLKEFAAAPSRQPLYYGSRE